jgi:hypothetical protein
MVQAAAIAPQLYNFRQESAQHKNCVHDVLDHAQKLWSYTGYFRRVILQV